MSQPSALLNRLNNKEKEAEKMARVFLFLKKFFNKLVRSKSKRIAMTADEDYERWLGV